MQKPGSNDAVSRPLCKLHTVAPLAVWLLLVVHTAPAGGSAVAPGTPDRVYVVSLSAAPTALAAHRCLPWLSDTLAARMSTPGGWLGLGCVTQQVYALPVANTTSSLSLTEDILAALFQGQASRQTT